MSRALVLIFLAACPLAAMGAQTTAAANPIRKVVTLLQEMQTKVTEEGKKEEEMYHKFMCYCKTSGGDLEASIKANEDAVSQLTVDIKSSEEAKLVAEETLKQAQDDRAAAKTAMAEATAVREKEAAAYAAMKDESTVNLAACGKAIKAIEQGMGSSAFLQTAAGNKVHKLVEEDKVLMEDDRSTLLAFLEGSLDYAPQSGQITGILKQMEDEMAANLKEATETEEAAIKSYEEMMTAKKAEIAACSATIESKLEKIAELGTAIAQMKNELSDAEEAIIADKKFLQQLEEGCSTKTAEWEEIKKLRSEELVALADTIKILNDDDALDLFKKTLPSPAGSSFMQVQVTEKSMRIRAASMLQAGLQGPHKARMDVILMALKGKKIGFEKVIQMIDEMIATLKKEQADDDAKKEYCAAEFDKSDDKKKALERKISDTQTAIAKAQEAIKTMGEEIEALKAGIVALDKDVAEATETRKAENEEFQALMSNDGAAKEILGFAKNRLNKFYNPKLYKAPAKEEPALVEVRAHGQDSSKVAPPPPPETFGPYTKKSEESNGVIAMIDMLIADLDKEMTEAKATEKNSQEDYEKLMADSAEKRTKDSKLLTQTETGKADTEAELQQHTEDLESTKAELSATMQYISTLHAECDWLIKYFDVRKEARTSEIDALGKAKAVLSGADYSLLQVRSRNLRSSRK
jgi:predicted  nucleic acid-binding Zn-ribbon protein